MATEIVLESLLVSCTVQDGATLFEDSRCRCLKTTFQSEEDFVDEVIHVAFKTAIVIAGKDDSLSAIEKDPARKLN